EAPLEIAYRGELALRELEGASCFRFAVLLALDGARVAREELAGAHSGAQFRLEVDEGASDAVTNGAGLAGEARTNHGALDVDLALGGFKRLLDHQAQHGTSKVLLLVLAVDGDLASAALDPDAGGGGLAAAGAIGAAELVDLRGGGGLRGGSLHAEVFQVAKG